MRIDLHTHSLVSDGTQTPTELIAAASSQGGLDVVAITDHDTSAGWDEALEAAQDVGVSLVRGMEISTRHRGHGVHLLAYLPDPTHPGLVAELDLIVGGRGTRAPAMVAALNAIGIELTVEEIVAPVPGRPHVADALVRRGVVASRDQAFEEYLNPGRPAYVDRYAVRLDTMIATIADAGGVTVIAHPWGRGRRGSLPPSELAQLAALGLSGVEVDHQDHDAETRAELRGVARELGLVVTGSSDHHGLGKSNHELGCNLTAPQEYERLLDLAAKASAASGRTTPEVVVP